MTGLKRVAVLLALAALLLCTVSPVFAGEAGVLGTYTDPTPNPFNPTTQTTSMTYTFDTSQYAGEYIVNRFHDRGWVSYTNCYGGADGVTYYIEVVKTINANKWVTAGTVQTVTWNGTTDASNTDVYNGLYYFKIVPKSSPSSTVFKSVVAATSTSGWLAYIRHCRSWAGLTPYTDSGVSRDPGKGTDCTGFLITALRESGSDYDFPYPQCDVPGLYNVVSDTDHPVGRALTTQRGHLSTITLKQSNLFCWDVDPHDGELDHVTMYTYTDDQLKKRHIHSSAANNGVKEEVVPAWYWATDPDPYVCYFNAIGIGG